METRRCSGRCRARCPGGRGAARDAHLVGRPDRGGAVRRRAARSGAPALAVPDRHADHRADRVPAHAVRRGDRLASALDRADDPGARHARRDHRGARATGSSRRCGSSRSASPSRSTRCCSTTTGCSRRPAGRDARRSPSGSRPGSCRCSNATRATCASLCAAAASSSSAMRQLSPLLAGSLERGLNLAEAMEARGYGRAGAHARAARSVELARPARARRVGADRRRGGAVALALVDRLGFAYGAGDAGARRRLAGDRRRRARRPARPVGLGEVDAPARARRDSCRTSTAVSSRAASSSAGSTRVRRAPRSSPASSRRSSRIRRIRS